MTSREPWAWRVHYDDETTLDEHTAEQGWASVDLARAVALELVPCADGLPALCVRADLARGERLVFARRRQVMLSMARAESGEPVTLATIAGVTGGAYLFAFGDGSVLLSRDYQAV